MVQYNMVYNIQYMAYYNVCNIIWYSVMSAFIRPICCQSWLEFMSSLENDICVYIDMQIYKHMCIHIYIYI